jgi:hypothetical protein
MKQLQNYSMNDQIPGGGNTISRKITMITFFLVKIVDEMNPSDQEEVKITLKITESLSC